MLEKLPESIGHALINQRAGMENVVYNQLFHTRQTARLDVGSAAFVFNGPLPVRFTADGAGLSPPLSWDRLPAGTEALVLIVEDADSPTPHPLVHAIVTGLERMKELPEGALSSPEHEGQAVSTGVNSFLRHAWLPPDPPRGHGQHRYVFQLFALSAGPSLVEAPGRGGLTRAILDEQWVSDVPSVPTSAPCRMTVMRPPWSSRPVSLTLDRRGIKGLRSSRVKLQKLRNASRSRSRNPDWVCMSYDFRRFVW